MSANTAAIQQLYVAYFNRPADFSGLAFWEAAVEKAKGSTAAVSAAFAASDEYKATYAGLDAAHVVDQIYHNLFNRGPDLEGLNFWTQRLLNKDVTIDNVVATIAGAAKNEDKVTITNKVAAAVAFSAALDTPAEALGYAGDKANGIAKEWLSHVGDNASLAVAIDKTALDAVIQNVVDNGPQPVGKTFALTGGMDILDGTSGNDVFNAYAINTVTGADAKNMNTFDSIDGGAGKDTLNLQVNETGTGFNELTDLGTVKNVEIINISGNTATVDASKFVGATAVNQLGSTAGAVDKLAVGTTAGFTGATNAAINVTAAGASAAVSFSSVADTSELFVDGAKLTSVTVSGSRVDANANDEIDVLNLHVQVAKEAQTMTVNTGADTFLVVDETIGTVKHVAALDASASTGGVEFDATGMTDLVTIKTGSGADTVTINGTTAAAGAAAAVNASVATGAGNDTIFVDTTGDGLTSVDAGAGNDKVTVTKLTGNGLNIQGGEGNDTVTIVTTAGNALQTTDVINGGAGTDIVSVAGSTTARVADDFIVFNKLLTGFETLKLDSSEGSAGATTIAFDASLLAASYATIDFAASSFVTKVGAQALVARGDLGATAAGYATGTPTTYAGTLNISERANGTVTAKADVVNLTANATAAADRATTLAGDVQTAAITVNNAVATDGTTDHFGSVTVASAGIAGLKSLTLTGSGAASVTNATGKLATVDASALGGSLADGSATAGLTYVSSNATTVETIKLGSGVDHLTLDGSVYGKADVVTGLNLVWNAGKTDLTASSDTLSVTALTGATKFTTTQTDIDFALKDAAAGHTALGAAVVFALGGDTYVYQDNGTAGSVDSADVLIKITGTVDLEALIKSLA